MDNKDLKKNLPYVLGTIAIIVVFAFLFHGSGQPASGEHDSLAQCLADKGVKMYGAWWCPHCQAQKKDFGDSFKLINYIECAAGNPGSGQTQECNDAKIEGYPTWEFADGTRLSGEQTFNKLAETAGCEISQEQK